jgi:regulatory protein
MPKRPIDDTPDACYHTGIRVLGYRWHARRELERKLADKGFSPENVAAALVRVEREGWIDDHRFATTFVRGHLRKGIGPSRIERELWAAGVDEETARAAIAETATEWDEAATLARLGKRKALGLARRYGAEWHSDEDARKKFFAQLLNQGYEYAAIAAALEKIIAETKES